METKKECFNYRAFVAIMIEICAVTLPVSGLLLHAYSEGKITSGEHSWFMIHILFGILFVVFFIWHIVLNRRVLLKHIKSGVSRLLPISREASLAFIIMAIIVMRSLHDISR